ncbi:MAG: response regulator, partial [Actinomycetota bacterium]|nr:response regulator [Actinomycetota bacterium]
RGLRQAGFKGLEVVEAEDGLEALDTIRSGGIDAVLADWNMPNMTGIEMLEVLREEDNDVTVGFVTSEASAPMRARAEDADAAFFVTKPFTAESLESALGPILGD